MPSSGCCVPECSGRGGHRFPTDPNLYKEWFVACQRAKWTPNKSSLVCRQHFTADDYVTETTYGTTPQRKQLKPGSIPSVFTCIKSKKQKLATPQSKERTKRARRRLERFIGSPRHLPDTGIGNEVVVETEELSDQEPCVSVESDPIPVQTTLATQTPHNPPMGIERYTHDDEAVHHFTGLETYMKFMFVLQTLGPAAYSLNYRWRNCQFVSIPNQLFMTLIKLRQHRSNYDLALMFDISEFSVSNIIITWINFMFYQWKELNIWPSREMVDFFMPTDFGKKFPTTRLILDGMECAVQKPRAPLAQQVTFSSYKNRNTAKVVVGSSPGGLVTHIPESYGGSFSDRQLIERSGLTQSCSPGDSLMADKGINVQDMFAPYDIKVNIPTFLKKGNQFSAKTLSKDKKIASKRVHIERIIGLAKTYKILTQAMSPQEAALATEIIFCCFMLCNFRTCIVPKDA